MTGRQMFAVIDKQFPGYTESSGCFRFLQLLDIDRGNHA